MFNSVFTHYGSFNWLPTTFICAQQPSERTIFCPLLYKEIGINYFIVTDIDVATPKLKSK
jgi:hypothetical protein